MSGRVDSDATTLGVVTVNVGDAGGEARSMGLASVPRPVLLAALLVVVDDDDDDDDVNEDAGGADVTLEGDAGADDGSCRRVQPPSAVTWWTAASVDD